MNGSRRAVVSLLPVVALLFVACGSSGGSSTDCAGTPDGTAYKDHCGICVADASEECGPIDLISGWDGTTFLSTLGVLNTASYGQVFTVGAGTATVEGFAVEVGYCTAAITYRGHLYAWDGTKATGASLFDSAPQTAPASSAYQLSSFSTGASGLKLSEGTYVFILSTSEDQAGVAADTGCRVGARTGNDTYAGGQFYYLNNGTDTSLWTSETWPSISQDLAFRVDGYVP